MKLAIFEVVLALISFLCLAFSEVVILKGPLEVCIAPDLLELSSGSRQQSREFDLKLVRRRDAGQDGLNNRIHESRNQRLSQKNLARDLPESRLIEREGIERLRINNNRFSVYRNSVVDKEQLVNRRVEISETRNRNQDRRRNSVERQNRRTENSITVTYSGRYLNRNVLPRENRMGNRRCSNLNTVRRTVPVTSSLSRNVEHDMIRKSDKITEDNGRDQNVRSGIRTTRQEARKTHEIRDRSTSVQRKLINPVKDNIMEINRRVDSRIVEATTENGRIEIRRFVNERRNARNTITRSNENRVDILTRGFVENREEKRPRINIRSTTRSSEKRINASPSERFTDSARSSRETSVASRRAFDGDTMENRFERRSEMVSENPKTRTRTNADRDERIGRLSKIVSMNNDRRNVGVRERRSVSDSELLVNNNRRTRHVDFRDIVERHDVRRFRERSIEQRRIETRIPGIQREVTRRDIRQTSYRVTLNELPKDFVQREIHANRKASESSRTPQRLSEQSREVIKGKDQRRAAHRTVEQRRETLTTVEKRREIRSEDQRSETQRTAEQRRETRRIIEQRRETQTNEEQRRETQRIVEQRSDTRRTVEESRETQRTVEHRRETQRTVEQRREIQRTTEQRRQIQSSEQRRETQRSAEQRFDTRNSVELRKTQRVSDQRSHSQRSAEQNSEITKISLQRRDTHNVKEHWNYENNPRSNEDREAKNRVRVSTRIDNPSTVLLRREVSNQRREVAHSERRERRSINEASKENVELSNNRVSVKMNEIARKINNVHQEPMRKVHYDLEEFKQLESKNGSALLMVLHFLKDIALLCCIFAVPIGEKNSWLTDLMSKIEKVKGKIGFDKSYEKSNSIETKMFPIST